MKCLTSLETRQFAAQLGFVDSAGRPLPPSAERLHYRGSIPADISRLMWFCRHVEESLQPNKGCLLWVVEWGVWDSSENLHLYYRLRESYHDYRHLIDAPGHLFVSHERPDLVSFLAIGTLGGWDMHLMPVAGRARAWLSHEGIVEFCSVGQDDGIVSNFSAPLSTLQVSREGR